MNCEIGEFTTETRRTQRLRIEQLNLLRALSVSVVKSIMAIVCNTSSDAETVSPTNQADVAELVRAAFEAGEAVHAGGWWDGARLRQCAVAARSTAGSERACEGCRLHAARYDDSGRSGRADGRPCRDAGRRRAAVADRCAAGRRGDDWRRGRDELERAAAVRTWARFAIT